MSDVTFKGIGDVLKLLPTATVIVYEVLNPIATNAGDCGAAAGYKVATGVLLGLSAFFCAFSTFTDSYVGADGKVKYGLVTPRGLLPFNDGGGDGEEGLLQVPAGVPGLRARRLRRRRVRGGLPAGRRQHRGVLLPVAQGPAEEGGHGAPRRRRRRRQRRLRRLPLHAPRDRVPAVQARGERARRVAVGRGADESRGRELQWFRVMLFVSIIRQYVPLCIRHTCISVRMRDVFPRLLSSSDLTSPSKINHCDPEQGSQLHLVRLNTFKLCMDILFYLYLLH
jgi:hypothetical protein